MTEKASAYIDLERCFQWMDGKGCHAPVNNSLTKLDALPLDPAVLQRVPFLAARGTAAWQAEPIGSVTNQTYRVTAGDESYVVRVAGPTTRYLDRAVEAHNAAIAAELGLAPPILFLDDRLLVTRFVTGARPLAQDDLDDRERLLQVGALLARLQRSDRPFASERHPFGEIDRYLGQHAHPRAVALRTAAQPVEAALKRSALPLVPAHIDAGAANFLLAADGALLLVDWEFSSMADPAWDIASILMQCSADDDEPARQFVAAILGEAGEGTTARLALFKAALTLVAGSWCAMEAASRRDSALMRIADNYLDRCAGLLSDPRMGHWLRTVTTA
ncbi:MAG TPA: choline/ethanolamine kinase family protein [Dongiaceae bacterium]|jgi:thiamine kinase-like enzyme